jgi:hypothetical protein
VKLHHVLYGHRISVRVVAPLGSPRSQDFEHRCVGLGHHGRVPGGHPVRLCNAGFNEYILPLVVSGLSGKSQRSSTNRHQNRKERDFLHARLQSLLGLNRAYAHKHTRMIAFYG